MVLLTVALFGCHIDRTGANSASSDASTEPRDASTEPQDASTEQRDASRDAIADRDARVDAMRDADVTLNFYNWSFGPVRALAGIDVEGSCATDATTSSDERYLVLSRSGFNNFCTSSGRVFEVWEGWRSNAPRLLGSIDNPDAPIDTDTPQFVTGIGGADRSGQFFMVYRQVPEVLRGVFVVPPTSLVGSSVPLGIMGTDPSLNEDGTRMVYMRNFTLYETAGTLPDSWG
ncbi:MAG: hypothetical protein AAGF12_25510, partial [Myxococcota bacterium]